MIANDQLPWGPLGSRTRHLCIDMQNIFAEGTPWHTPWMKRVLPNIVRLAEQHAAETIFTRFIPPADPEDMHGTWKRYYRKWEGLTTKALPPDMIDLVAPLRTFVPPARVLDKMVYSPFHGTQLAASLQAEEVDTLVISGGETDMCVLSAVLDAVDLGYRVVLPKDGLCSSTDRSHDSMLELYGNRFGQQVELADIEAILGNWF